MLHMYLLVTWSMKWNVVDLLSAPKTTPYVVLFKQHLVKLFVAEQLLKELLSSSDTSAE